MPQGNKIKFTGKQERKAVGWAAWPAKARGTSAKKPAAPRKHQDMA